MGMSHFPALTMIDHLDETRYMYTSQVEQLIHFGEV